MDNFSTDYSLLGIQKLDSQPQCDITFSSYNKIDKKTNKIEEQIFPKEMLLNKYLVNKNIIGNIGLIWRKDLFNLIENETEINLEDINIDIEYDNYNFWLKCVENNLNMICISDYPLFSTIFN